MVLSFGPQDECVKKHIGPSTKNRRFGSASHCDETWLQSKSAGTSDFLRVFFFVVVVGNLAALTFLLMTKFSQKASRFFSFKTWPGSITFWILHQCSNNWNDASERYFCLPLTSRNKQRTSPIQVRLTFPNCFVSIFLRHFPATKPLSIWWGETTKKQRLPKT